MTEKPWIEFEPVGWSAEPHPEPDRDPPDAGWWESRAGRQEARAAALDRDEAALVKAGRPLSEIKENRVLVALWRGWAASWREAARQLREEREVSDLQKALKTQAKKPWVKKAEAGEKAEGVRDALNAGQGNVVAGARKLGYAKEGLAQAEKRATKKTAGKKGAR